MFDDSYTAKIKLEREKKFRQKYLDRIKKICLMDDDFFQVCFQNDIECTELVLKIIMGKEDLKVLTAQTQYTIANLEGHSVRLDVFATDDRGIRYNIEVQRSNRGAVPRRARYNSSLIDSKILISDEDYSILPETYVIFITENDILQKGLPIYHIDRRISETGDEFDDGAHIIYANTKIKDDSPLGKLMEDFTCADPSKMNYSILKEKTSRFKLEDEGVNYMCDFFEELREAGRKEAEEEAKIRIAEAKAEAKAEVENARAEAKAEVETAKAEVETAKAKAMAEIAKAEIEAETAKAEAKAQAEAAEARAEARNFAVKNALRMLISGKLTFDEIAEYTNLSLDEVKEFAAITSAAK